MRAEFSRVPSAGVVRKNLASLPQQEVVQPPQGFLYVGLRLKILDIAGKGDFPELWHMEG
jgi:hypothetical protein